MQTPARLTAFDVIELFRQVPRGRSVSTHPKGQILYGQGNSANSVFYIHNGKVKLTVVSKHGKGRGRDQGAGRISAREL